jgi:hypothetical protein
VTALPAAIQALEIRLLDSVNRRTASHHSQRNWCCRSRLRISGAESASSAVPRRFAHRRLHHTCPTLRAVSRRCGTVTPWWPSRTFGTMLVRMMSSDRANHDDDGIVPHRRWECRQHDWQIPALGICELSSRQDRCHAEVVLNTSFKTTERSLVRATTIVALMPNPDRRSSILKKCELRGNTSRYTYSPHAGGTLNPSSLVSRSRRFRRAVTATRRRRSRRTSEGS